MLDQDSAAKGELGEFPPVPRSTSEATHWNFEEEPSSSICLQPKEPRDHTGEKNDEGNVRCSGYVGMLGRLMETRSK